jgi:uncharacterized membrane protein YdjX (TVP38/TMEM64 family)
VLVVLLVRSLPTLDPEAIAARVRGAGKFGPLLLFALFVVQCVVAPLPSEPIMMAAGFVYGPGAGLALAWLGVVAGALACFILARALGRPFAERFITRERLDAIDTYVTARGLAATFGTVLALRLFAFPSFDVVSYACGLARFPLRWFLLATALGAVPKAFAFTYAGANLADRPGWIDGLLLAGTFGLVLLGIPWLARRWRAR